MKNSGSLFVSVLLTFNAIATEPIEVLESTLKIPGLGEEVLYYGFAAGDKIVFNFEEVNGKELKQVEIVEFPSSTKFTDYKTTSIESKTFTAINTCIYKFRFVNTAISGRVCKIKIHRVPADSKTANFNTSVFWHDKWDTTYTTRQERYLVRKEYKPLRIIKEKRYVNSGSNATFKDGKSRVTLPISIPPNTVKWYYVVAASRNQNDIDKAHSSFNLIGQISKVIDRSGITSLSVHTLTQPPGGNYCDVVLFDYNNALLFEQKVQYSYYKDHSRENITSGIVEAPNLNVQNLYMGIRNPDQLYGIHVSMEVVAITVEEQWGIREIKQPHVTSQREPYLNN